MMYDDSYYTLKSGRRVYSNDGILGLGPDLEDGVYEGYDGGFGDFEVSVDHPWTREEREDIANEMIRRWTQWRDL